jgi:hypothetical protein
MMSSSRCALASSFLLLFSSTLASAQKADAASAQALFNEGRRLAAQGQFEKACPKFEESARLDDGIGTRLNLADCWERVGRTASAWSLFLEVAVSARSASQFDREKMARQRAASIEKRLSRLTIGVAARDETLEVRRNGQIVGRPQWEIPIPMDPGTYMLEATAPGKKSWRMTITVDPNGATSTVVVPELDNEESPSAIGKTDTAAKPVAAKTQTVSGAPSTGRVDETPPRTASADPSAASSGSSNVLRTVGWITAATGLVSVGAGAFFGNLSKSSKKLADDLCSSGPAGNGCQDDAELAEFHAANVRATNRATLAYTGFIAGGVLLTTGVILILTSPSSNVATSRPALRTIAVPLISKEGWGVALQQRW